MISPKAALPGLSCCCWKGWKGWKGWKSLEKHFPCAGGFISALSCHPSLPYKQHPWTFVHLSKPRGVPWISRNVVLPESPRIWGQQEEKLLEEKCPCQSCFIIPRVVLQGDPGCGKRMGFGLVEGPVGVTFHDSPALSRMEILGCAAWVRQQSPAPAGEAQKRGRKSGNLQEQGSAAAFPSTEPVPPHPGSCWVHSHHFSSCHSSPSMWMLPHLPHLTAIPGAAEDPWNLWLPPPAFPGLGSFPDASLSLRGHQKVMPWEG